MTEDEARAEAARIAGLGLDKIQHFVDLVSEENTKQNLISRTSVAQVWARHVLDSLQLLRLARSGDRVWSDIGSGAGFPGMVIAIAREFQVVLIEPRRRRAEFLLRCVGDLALQNVSVMTVVAQKVNEPKADIVSARAVAPTHDLLAMSRGFATPSTRFLFPKGERVAEDVESARHDWHGMFHVEQSLTNATSGILVIDKVRPK